MGFARRLVRKTVRKATPRSVRRTMHPVRAIKYAVTPRPVRQISWAVYTVTNPLGAVENKLDRSGPQPRQKSAFRRQLWTLIQPTREPGNKQGDQWQRAGR